MSIRKARSADTKDRILQAARRLFCDEGFERTTIRAVASEANIDPSMVMRYFESKDGLFDAVSACSVDLRLPDITAMPRDEVGERLVRHFLTRWADVRDDGVLVLLRTASSNEAARENMLQVFRDQVLPMVARIVADPREAAVRAEMMGSQLLGLAFCRFVLESPVLGGGDTELIIRCIGKAIQSHLFDEMPAGRLEIA